MAGLRGNEAWVAAAKQTAKGTAATIAEPDTGVAGTYKMPLSGGNIGPVRETDNLSETDASRDQGVAYVSTSGVEGSPEFYTRDASAPFWLHAALGSIASSGVTPPNRTHVITPGNVLPYITVWKNLSSTLWEEFRDCKVGSVTVSADAGSPLTIATGIQGVRSTRLTANPDVGDTIPVDNGPVYSYNDATVTLGGGVTALVSSFELTIENNVSRQQTDAVEPYDVVEGAREVSLSFDLIFESLDEYNKFHYGGPAGTTISPNIFQTSAIFTFTKGADNEIAFNLPGIAYQEFTAEPNAGGDPIVASVRAVAQRQTGGTPVVTATVKNQQDVY